MDGQTIKTRILYDELKNATDWDINTVDTYYKDSKPIRLLFQSLRALLTTKDVIVLLSGRGMRFYFPILYYFSKIFKTRVYHDLIGGNLDIYIKKYPKFKKYLNSYVVNWSETTYVKNKMKEFGISNFEYLPNFKRLNCISKDELPDNYKVPLKLCTFSRVMKEKGIEDAIHAVTVANERLGQVAFTLDIYGQVDQYQHEWFESVQKDMPKYTNYGGEIPYHKSTEVLKEYFALLFPTHFSMEGIPGTIIDAYAAGIPVISSKWRSFDDVVHEGKTGIGYELGNCDELIKVLLDVAKNPCVLMDMKEDCLKEAKSYLPEYNIGTIINRVEQK